MKKSVIISHYNEDIEWLKNIKKDIKIYLYTKGNKDLSEFKTDNIEVFHLENIGKEQQTYFYHIVNNYNNLEDIMYFIQANPFDHCINFYDKLYNNYIGPLSDFNLITSVYGQPNNQIYEKHINHSYENITPDMIIGKVFIDPWNDSNAIFNINYIIDKLNLEIKKENWIFNANGLYATTSNNIKGLDLKIYKDCLSLFSDNSLNMVEYAFERINKFILLR